MHLIHLPYRTSQPCLALLRCAQSISIGLQLGKIIWHKAYFVVNKRPNSSCNLLMTLLKWNRTVAVCFLLNVYHLSAIAKLKNPQSYHCKSETVYLILKVHVTPYEVSISNLLNYMKLGKHWFSIHRPTPAL